MRPLFHLPSARLATGVVLAGVCLFGAAGRTSVMRTLASPATPPAPPSVVLPTIGLPPQPPTTVPTATLIPVATPVSTPVPATPVPTSPPPTPTAIPSPTVKPVLETHFSLYAARVSPVNDRGDMSGLVTVRPGATVWLMMYYNVQSLPKSQTRITTYSVQYKGRTLYKVTFKGTMAKTELGRFSRYTVYQLPKSLPFGAYVYRASLSIGAKTQSADWKFSVGKTTRVVSGSLAGVVVPHAELPNR